MRISGIFFIFVYMDKEQINQLYDSNRLDEAEALLGSREDAWSLYMLGRIEWKRGNRGAAISLYVRSSALEPSGPASTALEQAREIMDFFNKDLYNP